MDIGILITAGVGVITTIVSGWTSYVFTRKKYNAEVKSQELENLKKSLDFYEDIVRDNNKKLQFYISLVENNRLEVYRLKKIVHQLLDVACLDNECMHRKFYSDEDLKKILGEASFNMDNLNDFFTTKDDETEN